MKLTLTPEEVAALTRRDRPAAQARVLRALGIPFRRHPTDSVVLVSRAAVEAVLWNSSTGDTVPKEPIEFDVNLEGIRNYGKTADSR
jgi:hypothetical protein